MKRLITLTLVAICLASQAAYAVQWLKQSTAVTVKVGPFVDSTDGVTAETGLTIAQADIRISKNGGAFAQTNNATGATHDENGYYGVPLDTTDTGTLGTLKVAVSESGALPVWQEFMVVPANVYDSLVAGTDDLETDSVALSGSSTAADNAEIVFDTDFATAYSTTNDKWQTEADVLSIEGTAASTSLASAADIVDEWESQSQADPTGFHVNVLEIGGTAQTANDNGADINDILADTANMQPKLGTFSTTAAGDIQALQTNVLDKMLGYTQLTLRKDAAIATDRATELNEINSDEGSGAGAYAQTTDSQQALVDGLPTNFGSLVISGSGAVDSLLQGFLNNTIAESTADNIAGNFETFWDNGDAATTNTVDDVGGGSSGGGQDYYFAGKTSGALVFQRVDGATAATPFVSVQSADSANFYNYSSNSMVAWNSIDGAEWTNYVSAMFTALDNTSPTPVAIPQYDTQDPFTSLATGLYIVQIYASDTYKDPMVARCLLYYDGAAWSEPTSNVNTQIDKIKRATIAN